MSATKNSQAPSERTRLKRGHLRADYEKETIYSILDAGAICHIGHLIDGAPIVLPTAYWREGNHVYWHGSAASRMLKKSKNQSVCLTVTHLDGFVMARSAFHHSANYRSVVILGEALEVTDRQEKIDRLAAFINLWWPGRWDELREINEKELKATTILSLNLDEASAKVRSGPPVDDEEDYELPIWAGVIPVEQRLLPIDEDPRNLPGLPIPQHILDFDPNQVIKHNHA